MTGIKINNYNQEQLALEAARKAEAQRITDAVTAYDQLFCEGVYVDGIHLGGMTTQQAYDAVQSQIQRRNDAWKVYLSYQGSIITEINADMLNMTVDVGKVLNDAWLQGHTGTVNQRYEAMNTLKNIPYTAYTAQPSGDTSVIDTVLAQVKAAIDTDPVDAALVSIDASQPYPFIFSEEVSGKTLDIAPLKTELYEMVSTMVSGTVELCPTETQPSVRVTDLKKHYMLLSSVYTPISTSSTDERNSNISLALSKVDGYVLQPGKQFSFNSVVGQRTAKNGFLEAVEYANGDHIMGIGGGVCQASTTLYQAAVCAGLQIVKREPHSDAVSYTDYGKDATVYWVGKRKIDLVFKNNTEEPIYIFATVTNNPEKKNRLIAKVSMYGADMGDVRYTLETQVIEELEPPSEPEYVKDTAGEYVTYTDQQKTVSKAQKGYVVESYRVKYEGNVETDRVLLYTDTYEAKAEKIYVGVSKR